jgi:hypothetical protein
VQAELGEARIGSHGIGIARPPERHVEHLLDAARARAHDRDAVAEQDRLVDRMGDEHHGLALVGPLHQREQLLLQDLARLRVERGERLVHQQDRGVHDQRAHQPDALLHPARELVGIMALEAGEPDELEVMHDPRTDVGARHARHRQPEGRVVVDGLPRQQAEMLEHHRYAVGRPAGDRPAMHEQLAGAEIGQAGDAAQERGLAAARRADHAHDLVAPDRERELMKGDDSAVEEELARALGHDGRLVVG